MLSREQVTQDLRRLKQIVSEHKKTGAPLATHLEVVNGCEMEVFSNVPRNLGSVYQSVLDTADHDFLVYQDERFTFGQALDLAEKLAKILVRSYAINAGDRIAICSRNNPQWCIAFMAITLAGAIAVPMNAWWTGAELHYGLQNSGARLLFADQERLDRLNPYIASLTLEVIAFKPDSSVAFTAFHDLLGRKNNYDGAALPDVNAEDAATIIYTSGSTGHPKGVLSTHRAIIHALYTWLFVKEINEILRPEIKETDPEFRPAILANVPLFHVTGCHAQFLLSFLYRRKFVMMYKWDEEVALQLIEQEKISVLHGVPTMTWEVMQSPNFANTDLSSLRSVHGGGTARPPDHLTMMLEKFPPEAIPGLGYGLTESNAIGAIISGKFYEFNPLSTGRPSPPVTQMKIVDDRQRQLGPNEPGEICIKGPILMQGYWKDPEETRKALKDGWFHTGDIGMLDDLGFLIILDRAKDIIIRGGENIGCAEVEYSIAEHPAVNEVSVFGIPDKRLGEVPCAVVMLRENCRLDDSELRNYLTKKLAKFKIPAYIQIQFEQLPRIASGKINKKLLRDQAIVKFSH